MLSASVTRRGLVAFAAGAAILVLGPGCATARPQACTPQAALRLEPLEIATSSGVARFAVELADTPKRREIGMMCRTSVAPDRGMLFDFGAPTDVAFWMRNTLIPLDMVFIAANGRVYSIVRNAQPQTDTPRPSGGPIRGVLEIAGGRAAQLGILPGDRVRHRIFPK